MNKPRFSIASIFSVVAIATLTTIAAPANAQSRQWTLRECCDYAVAHNISIKQTDNQRRQRELQLSTARNSRLPDLSANAARTSRLVVD